MKNIVLIGFMGAGKSVAAKELARRLKREAVSTDSTVEKKEKRPIADIFQNPGEAYFRQLEKEAVAELAAKENLIIDCGGGVFTSDENIRQLKKSGVVVCLSATPECLLERTQRTKIRPLLNVPDPLKKINELLAVREPFYRQAHHRIDTTGKTNQEVCDEIERVLSGQ